MKFVATAMVRAGSSRLRGAPLLVLALAGLLLCLSAPLLAQENATSAAGDEIPPGKRKRFNNLSEAQAALREALLENYDR